MKHEFYNKQGIESTDPLYLILIKLIKLLIKGLILRSGNNIFFIMSSFEAIVSFR